MHTFRLFTSLDIRIERKFQLQCAKKFYRHSKQKDRQKIKQNNRKYLCFIEMRLLIAHKSDESPIKYSKISHITFKKSLMRDNISIFGPIQTMQYDDGIN